MKRALPIGLLMISIGLFLSVISSSAKKIDQPFPGYLTFENGVVGAFYVSDWSGHQQGLTYHKIPSAGNQSQESVFSKRDYFHVSALPAISGLLFFLLGLTIFFALNSPGRWPFLWFHAFVGNYLILCPDFHLTYQFSYLLLFCFSMIPATMIHFALLFPEPSKKAKTYPILYWVPYAISVLILVPYIGLFHQPEIWIKIEYVAFFYLVFSYLFWIAELLRTIRKPQLEFNRIISKYLLLGQIIAFTIPLVAALAIFLADYAFPLNLAAPLAFLFPTSLFLGVILGRLRRSQMELVQSEKNAALGNLLAGLAHEINNPMTFIYSSMEPLKEMLREIQAQNKDKKWDNVHELLSVIEEGANRSKDIIESFRYFSHPEQKEHQAVNLHDVIDQSLRLLKPKCENRINIVKNYGQIPLFTCQSTEMGQVFVNLLSNACYAIPKNGTIEIATHAQAGTIEISIKDTGEGMSKDVMTKMFDPFFTTKPQGEGTGLGLSITLGIVKKYGGSLDAKSELGKGTEIVLRLPVNA